MYHPGTMRSAALSRTLPLAMVAALGVTWLLPLRWPAWSLAAVALAAISLVARRAAPAVAAALTCVAAIGLGYAAYALAHDGAFGPVTRLGYPMLVATGLRVPGGVCVLLLCGVVSLIPALLSGDPISERS